MRIDAYMKVVFTAHARDDIKQRFDYSVEHFGRPTAQKIFSRVDAFMHQTLAAYPMTGRLHASGAVLETWVPRTPFFIIYRVDMTADILTVLAIFHHAQDRASFDPDTN
jgi:plasmid stabilization system protein ParE